MSKRHPQEWIAAAVMAVVLALIALDLVDDGFNTWFDQHSFTTDAVSTLLGLAVAALVVDRISDRRRLRDQAQVMAAQGAMIAAQALRATQAVTAALDGTGDRDAAADELRTFMTMMLTGAPVLMDAAQTREFLEASQRLAAELARALVVTRSGDRPDDLDQRLNDAADQVRAAVQPLLQTLDLDQQSAVWGAARSPSDDASADDARPPTVGRRTTRRQGRSGRDRRRGRAPGGLSRGAESDRAANRAAAAAGADTGRHVPRGGAVDRSARQPPQSVGRADGPAEPSRGPRVDRRLAP